MLTTSLPLFSPLKICSGRRAGSRETFDHRLLGFQFALGNPARKSADRLAEAGVVVEDDEALQPDPVDQQPAEDPGRAGAGRRCNLEISPQRATRALMLRRSRTASMISPPTFSKSTSIPSAAARSCSFPVVGLVVNGGVEAEPSVDEPCAFLGPPAIPTTRAPFSLASWLATVCRPLLPRRKR